MAVLKVWDPVTEQWIEAAGASGDVNGPSLATDNALARFDGVTGKLIQNSVPLVDDDGNITKLKNITFLVDTDISLVPAGTTSPGRSLTLQGGLASAGDGGDAVLIGGAASGNAGDAKMTGGTVTSSGKGGSCIIEAKAGVGTNQDGGDVALTTGAATGSGTDGIGTLDGRVIGTREFAFKTANTSRASTTTLADDNHLAGLTLSANTFYQVTGALLFSSLSSTPNAKIAFTIPSGASMNIMIQSMDGLTSHLGINLVTSGVSNGILSITGFGPVTIVMISGIIEVDSTAGVLDLQWAQAFSNGSATVLNNKSHLRLEKI